MPGLELHTLRHEQETDLLPVTLASRAAEIAAGSVALYGTQAPETSGAFSFVDETGICSEIFTDTVPQGEDVIYNALGNRLWSVQTEIDKKDRLAQFPISLGALASEASISTTTGCWSLIAQWQDHKGKEAWRNDKGYMYIWNPEYFGYGIDRADGFKGVAVHRMAYNMKLRAQGMPDLRSYQQLDHVCRWPGCCNLDHLEVVDHKKNNQLRDQARHLEAAIISGQLIMGSLGASWLETQLRSSTTEFTNIIITTPAGPYRMVVVDKEPLSFRAEKEDCDLIEAVQAPAPSKYDRRSRRKEIDVAPDQKEIFNPLMFVQKKRRVTEKQASPARG